MQTTLGARVSMIPLHVPEGMSAHTHFGAGHIYMARVDVIQ